MHRRDAYQRDAAASANDRGALDWSALERPPSPPAPHGEGKGREPCSRGRAWT